jgi:hypothetical protein
MSSVVAVAARFASALRCPDTIMAAVVNSANHVGELQNRTGST